MWALSCAVARCAASQAVLVSSALARLQHVVAVVRVGFDQARQRHHGFSAATLRLVDLLT